MSLDYVLEEMRERGESDAQVWRWVGAIEVAMQNPAAWQDKYKPDVLITNDQLDPDQRWMLRPLYSLPPAAATDDWPHMNQVPFQCACRFVRRHDFAYPEQTEWCGLHSKKREKMGQILELCRKAWVQLDANDPNAPITDELFVALALGELNNTQSGGNE